MTSATWPPGVRRLVENYMVDPMQIIVGSVDLSAVDTVEQIIKVIPMDSALDHRGNMTAKDGRMKAILPYLKSFKDTSESDKMIIFVSSKRGADELAARI